MDRHTGSSWRRERGRGPERNGRGEDGGEREGWAWGARELGRGEPKDNESEEKQQVKGEELGLDEGGAKQFEDVFKKAHTAGMTAPKATGY